MEEQHCRENITCRMPQHCALGCQRISGQADFSSLGNELTTVRKVGAGTQHWEAEAQGGQGSIRRSQGELSAEDGVGPRVKWQ